MTRAASAPVSPDCAPPSWTNSPSPCPTRWTSSANSPPAASRLALGGSAYDWNDPFARMFLQILALIAEFEANLIRQRTREGMAWL